MGPSIRLAVVLVGVVATTGAVISTRSGDGQSGPHRSGSAPLHTKSSGVAAQARVDAFALVAKRIYAHEHAAVVGRSVVKHLSQNAALLRALRAGDLPKVRSEARQAVIPHEVRIRITHGARVLMDAGLPFVVQGAQAELRGPSGADLGHVEVSIQDVIGFVKLVDRETGTRVVVRGRRGIVQTFFPAAAHARLPGSGKVGIGGHSYLVRSFNEVDFIGNPLTVWILDPA